MAEYLLELKNITASYGEGDVLRDVSLGISKGEILGIVGESGSGKSTTARVMTGLLKPSAGEVLLKGIPVGIKRDKCTRRMIQMVFQNPEGSLNPRLRIGRIISDAMLFHGTADAGNVREKCLALLKDMELPEDTLDRFPGSFSGGQKQRIALMRALCVEPEILIADEPTSALDVSVQLKMLELIRRIHEERGLAIVFISHDLGVIHYLCSRVAVMKNGHVEEISIAEQFFDHPGSEYGRELLASVPVRE